MELPKGYVLSAWGVAVAIALAGFAAGDYRIVAWLCAGFVAAAGTVAGSARWGTVATALLGLGCNLYLFERKLDPSGSAICNVSAKVNCDIVNTSPASELFGVPIALLGAGFFLGVVVAGAFLRGPASRLHAVVGGLAAVGCVYSAYLAYQAYLIGAVCPMCVTIYASNVLLVVASVLGMREEGPADAPGAVAAAAVSSPAMLAVAATFLVTVLLGQTVYASADRRTDAEKVMERMAAQEPQPANVATTGEPAPAPVTEPPLSESEQVAEKLAEAYVQARGKVVLEGDEPLLGRTDAPYQVVEFACFGCPHCAQAFGHLQQLVAEIPDVNVRFRSFPLSGECNPGAARQGRPEVCRAAMAAQCANRQGKFWDFAGLVFANQQQLGDPLLATIAGEIGLDFDAFSSCLADPATLGQVERDAKAGVDLQIMGTPTLFLKGAVGEDWVEVCWGVQGVAALIQADKQGIPLREAAAAMCPME